MTSSGYLNVIVKDLDSPTVSGSIGRLRLWGISPQASFLSMLISLIPAIICSNVNQPSVLILSEQLYFLDVSKSMFGLKNCSKMMRLYILPLNELVFPSTSLPTVSVPSLGKVIFLFLASENWSKFLVVIKFMHAYLNILYNCSKQCTLHIPTRFYNLIIAYIILTKISAAQNEIALSYDRVRGQYFAAVIFAATIVFFELAKRMQKSGNRAYSKLTT